MTNKPKSRPSTQKRPGPPPPRQDPAVGQLQMSLLNMRQLYEQVTQEKQALQQQIQQAQAFTAACLIEAGIGDDKFFVPQKTLDAIATGLVEGFEITQSKSPKGMKVRLLYALDQEEDSVPEVSTE
jgi:hypothetical protein